MFTTYLSSHNCRIKILAGTGGERESWRWDEECCPSANHWGRGGITSRECQCCWRAEGDSELRATLTLQREWRKMAARVSECIIQWTVSGTVSEWFGSCMTCIWCVRVSEWLFMYCYECFLRRQKRFEEHLELVSCRPAVLTHLYHDTTHYTINGLSPYVPTHVDLSSVTSCS